MKERQGSVRNIRAESPGHVSMEYTEFYSVFDRGRSMQPIPGIDIARCACAVRSFNLAHHARVSTHFVRSAGERTIIVREYAVPGTEPLSGQTAGRVLPLEFIWRTHLMGSLWKRVTDGKIDPMVLGFRPRDPLYEGMRLPKMRLECTTKFERIDRHLNNAEAQEIAELTLPQWEIAWKTICIVVRTTSAHYESTGFRCPDGKLELGLANDGRIVVVDVFGTQDENRMLDTDDNVFSKDLIRVYLSHTPWKELLDNAKEKYPDDPSQWPEYPELPEALVRQVSERYAEVAKRYAGE